MEAFWLTNQSLARAASGVSKLTQSGQKNAGSQFRASSGKKSSVLPGSMRNQLAIRFSASFINNYFTSFAFFADRAQSGRSNQKHRQ